MNPLKRFVMRQHVNTTDRQLIRRLYDMTFTKFRTKEFQAARKEEYKRALEYHHANQALFHSNRF